MGFYKFIMISFLVCSLSGCALEKKQESLSEVVLAEGAQQADALIRMHKGKLVIDGATPLPNEEILLMTHYGLNVPTKRPNLIYDVQDGRGSVLLEQVSVLTVGTFPEDPRKTLNQWNLLFHKNIELNTQVIFNEGEAHLDLAHLTLKKMQIDLGQGDMTVDLSHVTRADQVLLNIADGSLVLVLPKKKGVVLSMQRSEKPLKFKGFRKKDDLYYNAAFKEGEAYSYIDIRIGSGNLQVRQE